MDIHPGPYDPSVLTLQSTHRSSAIWLGEDLPVLTVRRSDGQLTRARVHDRIVGYLRLLDIYGIYRIGHL